jgi:hypothetical protein
LYPFSYSYFSYGVKPIEEAPFIDETGIKDFIDYDITQKEVDWLQQKNWEGALKFLHRHGLDLQKGERLTKVIVIRDPKKE